MGLNDGWMCMCVSAYILVGRSVGRFDGWVDGWLFAWLWICISLCEYVWDANKCLRKSFRTFFLTPLINSCDSMDNTILSHSISHTHISHHKWTLKAICWYSGFYHCIYLQYYGLKVFKWEISILSQAQGSKLISWNASNGYHRLAYIYLYTQKYICMRQ